MKQTIQKLYWLGLLATLLTVPALAENSTEGAKPADDNETRCKAAENRLNLSAEQKEKMQALRQNQKQQMEVLAQSLKEKRTQLRDALNNPDATRKSIASLVDDVKTTMSKMVDQRIDDIFAIKSILTADQFTQMQANQKSFQDKQGDRPSWFRNKGAKHGKHNRDSQKNQEE